MHWFLMLLTLDLWPYPCPVVLGWRDRVEESVGQGAHSSPVKLVGCVPKGLPAGPRARHRFSREFYPQTLTEGAAHREVQGEMGHCQEDPHPVPHTTAWPQSRRTAGKGTMREKPFRFKHSALHGQNHTNQDPSFCL